MEMIKHSYTAEQLLEIAIATFRSEGIESAEINLKVDRLQCKEFVLSARTRGYSIESWSYPLTCRECDDVAALVFECSCGNNAYCNAHIDNEMSQHTDHECSSICCGLNHAILGVTEADIFKILPETEILIIEEEKEIVDFLQPANFTVSYQYHSLKERYTKTQDLLRQYELWAEFEEEEVIVALEAFASQVWQWLSDQESTTDLHDICRIIGDVITTSPELSRELFFYQGVDPKQDAITLLRIIERYHEGLGKPYNKELDVALFRIRNALGIFN